MIIDSLVKPSFASTGRATDRVVRHGRGASQQISEQTGLDSLRWRGRSPRRLLQDAGVASAPSRCRVAGGGPVFVESLRHLGRQLGDPSLGRCTT